MTRIKPPLERQFAVKGVLVGGRKTYAELKKALHTMYNNTSERTLQRDLSALRKSGEIGLSDGCYFLTQTETTRAFDNSRETKLPYGYLEHIQVVKNRILARLLKEIPRIDGCYRLRFISKSHDLSDIMSTATIFTGNELLDVETDNLFSDLSVYYPEVAQSFNGLKQLARTYSNLWNQLADSCSSAVIVEAAFHSREGNEIERRVITRSIPNVGERKYSAVLNHGDILHPIENPAEIEEVKSLHIFDQAISVPGRLRKGIIELQTRIQNALDSPIPKVLGHCSHLTMVDTPI